YFLLYLFFFTAPSTTVIYTLSLHDALPIYGVETSLEIYRKVSDLCRPLVYIDGDHSYSAVKRELGEIIKNMPNASILLHDTFYQDRKSTRLNSSHVAISYAVFCLKKKKNIK